MKFLWHVPVIWKHFKCVHSEKQQEKSSIVWRILWHKWWNGSTPDTKAEWGTIMKHRAIKGVPDRLSKVWWASVSLWSSRAPQLINHQGGAWGARSLKPSITMLGGRQSPAHFHVLLFPPPTSPPPTFDSQIKVHRWPGRQRWLVGAIKWSVKKKRQKERKRKKDF